MKRHFKVTASTNSDFEEKLYDNLSNDAMDHSANFEDDYADETGKEGFETREEFAEYAIEFIKKLSDEDDWIESKQEELEDYPEASKINKQFLKRFIDDNEDRIYQDAIDLADDYVYEPLWS